MSIPVLGKFSTPVTVNNITLSTTFIVIDNKEVSENLLGYKSLIDFKIVEIMKSVSEFSHCIKTKYKNLFENRIGKLIGAKVSIKTDPTVRPTQQPHYQVPFHMIPGTKSKLQELIDQGIIEPVPLDSKITWISPMMPVEKGKAKIQKGVSAQQRQAACQKANIRITSDNKKLNKAIIRQTRPMPSIQTLSYDLNDKWFSKLDIRDAFNQIELD